MMMCEVFILLILASYAFSDSCVTYTFEENDYESLFTSNEGICTGMLPWNIRHFENTSLSDHNERSTKHIYPQPTVSCVNSFPFPVTPDGIIEMNIFMQPVENTDFIQLMALEYVNGGNNVLLGLATSFHGQENFGVGWNILRFSIMSTTNSTAYLSIMGIASSTSTVLVDSFRYIPPGIDESECEIYAPVPTTTETTPSETTLETTTETSSSYTEALTPSTEPTISSSDPPISSTDSPTSPTEPPISPTEPPISSTDPPTSPIEPPISPTEPPISSTDPPTSPTEPPISPTEPPTSSTDPPTSPIEPPISPTEPPISSTDPPTSPTEPPISPTEPPISSTDPPTSPTEPPISPTAPPTSSTEPPTSPTEPITVSTTEVNAEPTSKSTATTEGVTDSIQTTELPTTLPITEDEDSFWTPRRIKILVGVLGALLVTILSVSCCMRCRSKSVTVVVVKS